ncbi:Major facilitator superfamily MFS_1 protein [Streptomyces venezuelae]|uniref:MFS transporter n=1 Tax=Streptomyces gardneri TaxID=66892 RepID=UPI0006BC753F|nr:MFS transporter [Streptomyces gardneri]ALO12708.1 Major facilitator superfamily MFS_1 protein [Streptomyces venezuelae]QPK49432.1 MFS transporter [Streptomyces gardneri]WRK40966.1 MFS transporter [Streptomyces venezuelae]CUM36649.1 major facilitator superfamily MFS_1 [Streptomyces venezuelae]
MALSSSGTGSGTGTAGPASGTAGPDSPAAGRPTRGLLPLLLAGNSAMYALYVGVAGMLLALQIEDIDPANKVANFGLVAGISAIFATVFNPVAGALSDRSGRRNPWILGGGLLALPVMLLLGSVDTILLVTIAWCLGQAVMNIYQAAITSVVPDRVPMGARGKASAAVGLGLPVGSTIGALVGAAFSDDYRTGYLVFGAIVAGTAVLFTACAREERMPPKAPLPVKQQIAAFGSALRHHDFRWAFIGRALLILGYFAVAGFQLYILKDHTVLPAGLSAEEAVAVLTPLNAIAMVVSTVLGGWLSDRFDRRKLFVGASAALAAVALVIPAVSTSWTAMLAFSVVNGLGFGCYMAVDTALVTMVLPTAEDAARDMGVLNVANAGPQIIAPFVASLIVSLSGGGYTALFLVAAVLSVLGALAVRPIRGVR